MSVKTFKIKIKGQVQGVGFRPFVFSSALKQKINGCVYNNIEGVIIKINTTKQKANKFLESILKNSPKIAVIKSYKLEEITTEFFADFRILRSTISQNINIPLTPDFAICNECKKEIKEVENRRFGYPFTTCVNCGPRYAITTKFPFERAYTSLNNFVMCDACKTEYKNPNNRRFHSQTNSCYDCGIKLELVDTEGNNICIEQRNILQKAADYITQGKIIAIKNTSGYLICCDATNPKIIKELRQKKKRSKKPFAVLYETIETVENDFQLTAEEKELLISTIAPIVLLRNTKKTAIATKAIAPNLNQTGVLLPSSALLELLMNIVQRPIVCTSGNIHNSPIIFDKQIAQDKLKTIVDYIIHHNLPIQFPQDDSVVKVVDKRKILLRRSRGLAPNYLTNDTNHNHSSILSMGAHLKSTFSLVPNSHTYVSQYFGNLNHYEVLERYEKTMKQYLKLFNCIPKTILIDSHPTYQSSTIGKKLAKDYNASLIEIQHHKAHFASVLAEYQLFDNKEKILGVVWDGAGYGDDNSIWGGEFFIYENKTMKRANHFDYFDWLANDKMAQEPRISLLSLVDKENRLYIKNKFSKTEWKVYTKMLENNNLKTSSVGRLFDAVASALDIKDFNTFEAEAPMLLENYALNYSENTYIDFLSDEEFENIPSKLIIEKIIKTYNDGICKEKLAFSFIYTLSKAIIKIAKKHKIKMIACSGGVFQNSVLIRTLIRHSEMNDIKLKINRNLSTNDENISFGQLMYYQNIKKS